MLYLPCSPECANWLRYGVQPKNPGPGPAPAWPRAGARRGPTTASTSASVGRRVQVSRHWSGKTLRQHKADRAAVVRAVLAEAGIDAPDPDRIATTVLAADGKPRFVWEDLPVASADYATVVMDSVLETLRRRREYDDAKQTVASRAGPQAPVDTNSATDATTAPRAPGNQPDLVA